MEIIVSPLPLHLLEVSRAMAHVMNPELREIDRELTLIFRRYVTVLDLQLRLLVVAEQLGESCPKSELRGSLLERVYINWPQRKAVMLREFFGACELITKDDL
jgi:hypothetical protein